MDETFSSRNVLHKQQLNERTKAWGRGNNKFKPKPYVPQAAEGSKPWHHVKNGIIDDAKANNQEQLDMKKSKVKEFLQKREQNHRRNIIEMKRNEPTSWESFSDETQEKRQYIPTAIFNAQHKEAKDLTVKDRNFFRRKLTKAALSRSCSLKGAMDDLVKHGVCRGRVNKKKQ